MKVQADIAVETAGSSSSVGARRALAVLGADRIGGLRDCGRMPLAPAAGPEVGGRLYANLCSDAARKGRGSGTRVC
jgi:hypothetical protein